MSNLREEATYSLKMVPQRLHSVNASPAMPIQGPPAKFMLDIATVFFNKEGVLATSNQSHLRGIL
jgi:hypothetical protein